MRPDEEWKRERSEYGGRECAVSTRIEIRTAEAAVLDGWSDLDGTATTRRHVERQPRESSSTIGAGH
jgi:hypothetical protein